VSIWCPVGVGFGQKSANSGKAGGKVSRREHTAAKSGKHHGLLCEGSALPAELHALKSSSVNKRVPTNNSEPGHAQKTSLVNKRVPTNYSEPGHARLSLFFRHFYRCLNSTSGLNYRNAAFTKTSNLHWCNFSTQILSCSIERCPKP